MTTKPALQKTMKKTVFSYTHKKKLELDRKTQERINPFDHADQ
jgi:hypothetical protein